MRVALRADGGRDVGLGHVGRCAALAQAFRKLGQRPVFIDAPKPCEPWLKRLGLPTQSSNGKTWDVVIADSYRFTSSDWKKLRALGKNLVAFDDLGDVPRGCDVVLNGNAYGPDIKYAARGAKLLLGARYMPLRSEYWTRPKSKAIRPKIRRVLITLGGGDGWGLAEEAAQAAAAALPHAEIHAVIGPLMKPRSSSKRIVWHKAPKSLKTLFASADLAICGGGQTVYEAALMGVPILSAILADNQELNSKALRRSGAALPLGRPDKKFPARLGRLLNKLDGDRKRRARMSASGRRLVDGRGAIRVAERIMREAR